MHLNFFSLSIFLHFALLNVDAYRLNVPKVLLPYFSSIPVNFTLEISETNGNGGGCFSWKSSRSEIVAVSSETVCSTSATVHAISKHRQKLTAVVFAEDSLSGITLRCDVMVDVINSIEIVTTTRELFLEDAPEMFLVRAKNDQDDSFSSLNGIQFDWRLDQNENSLKFVQFSDSKYETTSAIRKLEIEGNRGDRILVEGLEVGRASLSVKLNDQVYQNVNKDTINLIVVAHLMLLPSEDLFFAVGTSVQYEVQLIKQGRAESISMPSVNYYLAISDGQICELNSKTSMVTAKTVGTTEISLKNRDETLGANLRMPSAFLRVVNPVTIEFDVIPGHNWVLETGRIYEIYLRLLDGEGHSLYISENENKLKAKLDEPYFEVLFQSRNNSYFLVKTQKAGRATLFGEFDWLKCTQNAEVFETIVVAPNLLVFPWDPNGHSYQRSLKVHGGSGTFVWMSDNRNVAIVSENNGFLKTGFVRGFSRVVVSDVRNRLHQAEAKVIISDVTSFEIGDGPREVAVGETITLPFLAYADVKLSPVKRVPILDCSHLAFEIKVADTEKFNVVTDTGSLGTNYVGCSALTIFGKRSGSSEVSITLNRLDATPLVVRLRLSVFNHLKIIDPDEENLLLVPGSSWQVKFTGGPDAWTSNASDYFTEVEMIVANGIRNWWPSSTAEATLFRSFFVQCEDYAESEVILSVGNKKSSSNPFPVIAKAILRIICATPDKLSLLPELIERENFPVCPLLRSPARKFPIHYNSPSTLLFSAFDGNSRKFHNISSLVAVARVSDSSLLEIPSGRHLLDSAEKNMSGKTLLIFPYVVKALGKLGSTTIKVEVSSVSILSCLEKRCMKELKIPLTTSLNVELKHFSRIEPKELLMLNHPSNVVNLHIVEGSGYFHVPLRDYDKMLASIHLIDSKIEILPKKNGEMSLEVFDICMNVDRPATSHVSISSIHKMKLVGPQLVEVNNKIVVSAVILDEQDRPIIGSSLFLLEIKVIVDNTVISVKTSGDGHNFTIRGLQVGMGSFIVAVHQTGTDLSKTKIIRSNAHLVQVFAPLELRPKRVTLIVGAKFQLRLIGGPQASSIDFAFSINDSSVADVRDIGLIEAKKLGHAQITCKVLTASFLNDIITQHSVILDVVKLNGIQLSVPSTILYVNTSIAVHVIAVSPTSTPMAWGSLEYPFIFEWSLSNGDVARLGDVNEACDVIESSENRFARIFHSTSVGSVTLKVTVKIRSYTKKQIDNVVFTDSVQMRILEPLTVVSPSQFLDASSLIVTPNTGVQLRLNNKNGIVSYVTNPGSLVSVDSSGYLLTSDVIGSAVVYINVLGRLEGTNETIALHVLVSPAHHVRLNLMSDFHLGNYAKFLPLGFNVEYFVSVHDSFGRMFHATNNALMYRPNRFDLTEIVADSTNRTFFIRLKEIGETVLKIWDPNNERLVDYLRISAGETMNFSRRTFFVGELMCFASSISADESFMWSSSKRSVVDVLPSFGVGVAKSVGEAVVVYSVDSNRFTKCSIRVSAPTKIEFVKWKLAKFASILSKNDAVDIPFVVMAEYNQTANLYDDVCIERMKSTVEVSTELNEWFSHSPFTCRISFEDETVNAYDFLSVSTKFSLNEAMFACSLTTLKLSESQQLLFSRFESSLIVSVAHSASKLADNLRLPFYASFYVEQKEITLDNVDKTTATLNIFASSTQQENLKIVPSVERIVSVSFAGRKEISSSLVVAEIELLSDSVDHQGGLADFHLMVVSDLTKQIVNVPVRITVVDHQTAKRFYSARSNSFWGLLDMLIEAYGSVVLVLFTVFFTIVAMYFGFRTFFAGASFQMPGQENGLPSSPSSPAASPRFIQWRSYGKPTPHGQSSITTSNAQPYLWSLSQSQTPPSHMSPTSFSQR